MSKENVGGAAFPTYNDTLYLGMSMRDYFAAKAMAALIHVQVKTAQQQSAESAYEWADAMLKAREQ